MIEHPPWASAGEAGPSGVEVELVEGFALEHDARVRWFPGVEEGLLRALEHRELDVVVGGLTSENPWSARFELARPYFESRLVVGAPPGEAVPDDLAGARIAVRDGSHVAALVQAHGAIPVRVADLSAAEGLVAAEEWRVRALGLHPTETELAVFSHAVAVVPGENALRVALERFLLARQSDVPRMLEAAA